MEKEFVPYELALALKKLGFDEPCLGRWLVITEWEKPTGEVRLQIGSKVENYSKNQCAAPLYQQAFRWFREKYPELDFGVGKIHNGTNNYHYHINLQWEFFEGTYEEAELACLKKLIEIVKNLK